MAETIEMPFYGLSWTQGTMYYMWVHIVPSEGAIIGESTCPCMPDDDLP